MSSDLLKSISDPKLRRDLDYIPDAKPSIMVQMIGDITSQMRHTDSSQRLIIIDYLQKSIPASSDAEVKTALANLRSACASFSSPNPAPNHVSYQQTTTLVISDDDDDVIELDIEDSFPTAPEPLFHSRSSSSSTSLPESSPASSSSANSLPNNGTPPVLKRSIMDVLMSTARKQRPPPTDIEATKPAKKPKMASSMESKYVPTTSSNFLSKMTPTGFASASVPSNIIATNSKVGITSSYTSQNAIKPQGFSGYDELGLPATTSSPSPFSSSKRSNSQSLLGVLPPHTTPKSLQPQRSIGVLADVKSGSTLQKPLVPSLLQADYVIGPSSSSFSSVLSATHKQPSTFTSNPKKIDLTAYSAGPVSSKSQTHYSSPFGVPSNAAHAAGSRQLPSSMQPKSSSSSASGRSGSRLVKYPESFQTKPSLNPMLSKSQKDLVEKALNGESFFFTGAAGTGKSYVMQEIINTLRAAYGDPEEVAVTAPTGMAAIELGGTTIYSFAGIGLGEKPTDELVLKVRRSPQASGRWRNARVLIIDEISMISSDLFDKLDTIGKKVRGDSKPFGGIQIIICGDFFQLPPINKNFSPQASAVPGLNLTPKVYAFQSPNWKTTVPNTYVLDQIFRQQGDTNFISILNDIRMGMPSIETYNKLRARVKVAGKPFKNKTSIEPTRLFPKRQQVDNYNVEKMRSLPGPEKTYDALDATLDSTQESLVKTFFDNCTVGAQVSLRIGAQVILLRNDLTRGLVNGSRGTVIRFEENDPLGKQGLPVVKFENDLETVIAYEEWKLERGDATLAIRSQLPLALGWALSIHKCQGMTLPSIEVSLNAVFADGQAYVALSRAQTLDGLIISEGFDIKVIRTHPDVVKFYKSLSKV